MKPIILASASPRRKQLLTQMPIPIGLSFQVLPAKGEEVITSRIPSEIVSCLSLQKAAEISALVKEPSIIIGADTIVSLQDEIMGKPKDEADAFRMLHALQGNTHSVFTGVTILVTDSNPQTITFFEETLVSVSWMTDTEIKNYIATKEPMDKAGAYAIQGLFAPFITKIEGDYNNVVGLPLAHLYQVLKKIR